MKKLFASFLMGLFIVIPVLAEESPDALRLKPKWQGLDTNEDGFVAMDELHPILAAAINRSDFNQDGKISLDEYVAFDLDPGASALVPLSENVRLVTDIPYANSDDPRQQLDVYLPKKSAVEGNLPVIAYIHGGGWQQGSKIMGRTQLMPLIESGRFAAVSIGYRLSWQDSWPAQIHDVKAAIRWIRANAEKYGFDASRVCAMGASAGGHLSAMLGVTNGADVVEGELGNNLAYSSDVQCAIDYFGPADLRHKEKNNVDGVVANLLGGSAKDKPALAANASPLLYVDRTDPPFLIIHGTADPLVNYTESVELNSALNTAGVEVYFQTVNGAGHGNFGEAAADVETRVQLFLDRILYGEKNELPVNPLDF